MSPLWSGETVKCRTACGSSKNWNERYELFGDGKNYSARIRAGRGQYSGSPSAYIREIAGNKRNWIGKSSSDFMPFRTGKAPLESECKEKSGFYRPVYNRRLLYGRSASSEAGTYETSDAEYEIKVIGETDISKGTVNASLVSPRELFIEALEKNAVSIILMHNHPSGDPVPSKNDILLTRRVKDAGNLIGIELLDHIIIGNNCYISFAEQRLL